MLMSLEISSIFVLKEPSWRHDEYRKSRKASHELYSSITFTSFQQSQFLAICNLFKSVFCTNKKNTVTNHKLDEYIFKVLLPEALIKICMFMYESDKENAEEYLLNVRKDDRKDWNIYKKFYFWIFFFRIEKLSIWISWSRLAMQKAQLI